MINFLGAMSPLTPWPTLTEVHQNLHKIVAEAAKLTNGLRVCRSVCWIDFPLTGDLWALNHEQTSDVIYKESLRRTSELDARAFSGGQEMVDWATRRAAEAEAARQSWPGQSEEAWARRWESMNPKPFDRSRRAAKVQIVLWPSFTSNFPVMQNTATGGGINVGEERHTIIKAQVVYYSGKSSDQGDQAEDFTLLQHIQRHRGLANDGRLGWFSQPLFRVLTGLFITLLLVWILSASHLQQQFGSQPDVEVIEVIEEHEFAGRPIFSVTSTMAAAGIEIEEHSDTTPSSASTSTTKPAFRLPFIFGGKGSSDVKPAASTTSTETLPVQMEPEAISMPSGQVPETVREAKFASTSASKSASKSASQSASKASSKYTSLKSTTKVTVTESEWTQIGEDGAKRIMFASPLDSSEKITKEEDRKSHKSTTSTKPRPVTEEDSVQRPVSITMPESVESPASVSSPPSPPETKSPTTGSWTWLHKLDLRRFWDDTTERNDEHLTTSPVTQPALTTIEEKKTIIEPKESTSKSTMTSKAHEPTVADEATKAPDSKSPSSGPSHVPEDGHLLAENINAQTIPSDSSTSINNEEPVIQVAGPSQVTLSGHGHPVTADGDIEFSSSSSSSPTTDSDGWNTDYASIVTHVSKWTNTRVKTYTAENGQVVTVSEEVPQSKESLKSVAPWHRHFLPG